MSGGGFLVNSPRRLLDLQRRHRRKLPAPGSPLPGFLPPYQIRYPAIQSILRQHLSFELRMSIVKTQVLERTCLYESLCHGLFLTAQDLARRRRDATNRSVSRRQPSAGVKSKKATRSPITKKIPSPQDHSHRARSAEHRDTKINFIDTPGYAAFIVCAPRFIADCGMVIVDAKGVRCKQKKFGITRTSFSLPRMMVIANLIRTFRYWHRADSAHNIFSNAQLFAPPIGEEN